LHAPEACGDEAAASMVEAIAGAVIVSLHVTFECAMASKLRAATFLKGGVRAQLAG
jgi:hypothetical protein